MTRSKQFCQNMRFCVLMISVLGVCAAFLQLIIRSEVFNVFGRHDVSLNLPENDEKTQPRCITCPTKPDAWMFDYKGAMGRLNAEKVSADDPRLIQLIRDHYIIAPSTEPYNLNNPNKTDYSSQQNAKRLEDLLSLTSPGFYIECGAYDGEYKSTSLYFEKTAHWNGLLIEADPVSFARLRSKNRKAFMLNACLCTDNFPSMITFNVAGETGRIMDGLNALKHQEKFRNKKEEILVQCFPLYSVLLALNQLKIDFFGLDVEGVEGQILKTVPWQKTNFSLIQLEFAHDEGGYRPIQQFMETNGFKSVEITQEDMILKHV